MSCLHFSCIHEVYSKVKGIAQLSVGILFGVLLAPSHGPQATFYMANSRQLSAVRGYRQSHIVAAVLPGQAPETWRSLLPSCIRPEAATNGALASSTAAAARIAVWHLRDRAACLAATKGVVACLHECWACSNAG